MVINAYPAWDLWLFKYEAYKISVTLTPRPFAEMFSVLNTVLKIKVNFFFDGNDVEKNVCWQFEESINAMSGAKAYKIRPAELCL